MDGIWKMPMQAQLAAVRSARCGLKHSCRNT